MSGCRRAWLQTREHDGGGHREQGGQEGQPGQQHDGDAQGQRNPEVVVDPEAGEQQRDQGQDDGTGRGRDRHGDPGEGADDGGVGLRPGPEFLAEPVDEEEPVIGTRAEQQDDKQRLGDRRDLQAVGTQPGYEPLRDKQRHNARHERHQQRDRGSQHDQQQHQDEHDGVQRDPAHRLVRALIARGVRGHLASQVKLQARRWPGGGEGRRQVRHDRTQARSVGLLLAHGDRELCRPAVR